jgi:hypothetical protein
MQFIMPVLLLEKTSILMAVRRSWELARRRFWWLVGAVMVIALFNLAVVSGPVVVLQLLATQAFSALGNSTLTTYGPVILTNLVNMGFSILYTPFTYIVSVLLYFDLRVRTEGFDIALQIAPAEQPLETTIAQTPTTPLGPLVTGSEIGSFVGLTFMSGALLALVWSISLGAMMALIGLGRGF